MKRYLLQKLALLVIGFFMFPSASFAYTTNMNASVVLGQTSFSTNSTGTTSSTLNGPRNLTICNGKLILADLTNSRVLIWNSIPTQNGQAADVVVGQPDFTSNTINNGGISAATLNKPLAVGCFGNKLFIADTENSRVLIYNSIPTSNGASADVVVGQPDFSHNTVNNGGIGANTLNRPHGVTSDGQRLFILDADNRRLLIFNSIPTTNNASADTVIGQTNFTSNGISCSASGFDHEALGVYVYGGKIVVAQTFLTSLGASGHRVLIFNSIPTSNGASADVVIGQSSFTDCSSYAGTAANTVDRPFGVFVDSKGRLYIGDRGNQRVLVFNTIPSSNKASADLVIGQPNFTSNSVNQGQASPGANTLNGAAYITGTDTQLFITDSTNNRVLIYNDITSNPSMSLGNNISSSPNGNNKLRFTGSASVDSPYTVKSVQYQINGGGWNNATLTNSNAQTTSFYFDFSPTDNNYSGDGYTIQVQTTSNNQDVKSNGFYFTPFNLNSPGNNAYTTSTTPTFSFSINQGRFTDLSSNLDHFQVQVQKINDVNGNHLSSSWQTYIDNIPVSFQNNKNNSQNLQQNSSNTYETTKFLATYSSDNSNISVYAKPIDSTGNTTGNTSFDQGGTVLSSGTYQWQVVAIDKSGHQQTTGSNTLRVNSLITNTTGATIHFPLSILYLSTLGNVNLSTDYSQGIKSTYTIYNTAPTFYGIAYAGATVTLTLTDSVCVTSSSSTTLCTKTYTTTANPDSRFGINIPTGDLNRNKTYTVNMNVTQNGNYNELPEFSLKVL